MEAVLRRHGLAEPGRLPQAGRNPTYPTFLCGDLVVKFFGGPGPWVQAVAAERAALSAVARNPIVLAPRLVAHGRLAESDETPWPYLIATRVAGASVAERRPPPARMQALAEALGDQVRRLQAIAPDGLARVADWRPAPLSDALARASLPPHLAAQAPAFLDGLPHGPPVAVHADLVAAHVFCETHGRLSGIIDWGDAVAADRHLELIQVFRDLCACDREVFQVFLQAAGWPREADFPRKALGQALQRQALGCTQHHAMDVFEPIAARWPLADVATLEDLAELLFGCLV